MFIIATIVLTFILIKESSKNSELLRENKRLKEQINIMEQWNSMTMASLQAKSKPVSQELQTYNQVQLQQTIIGVPTEQQESSVQQLQQVPSVEQQLQQEQLVQKLQQVISVEQQQQQLQSAQQQQQVHPVASALQQPQRMTEEQKLIKEKEQKNVAILVTGAICIVLSAIVFLMSTWNVIPDILKTSVLLLLTLVFLGGSYIAKEKFRLEKASQTFFYLAMAYIPICLFSISVFELFGHYLSIYGEGKYIYLTCVSVFVALIYYMIYKNKNNRYMLYGSILSQVFSVIAFSLVLSDDIEIIGINLLIYNILLIFFTKMDIFVQVQNFILAAVTVIAMFDIWNKDKALIFVLALLAINYLILEIKKSHLLYAYMFNISLILTGIYMAIVYNGDWGQDISHLVAVLSVVLVYIVENALIAGHDRKNLQNALAVTVILTISILHIESLFVESMIKPYMISIVQLIILVITYIMSQSIGKYITALLIPLYYIITGTYIISELDCSYHAYVIFALVTCVAGDIFRKKAKILYYNILITSNLFLSITYLVVLILNYDEFVCNIVYSSLIVAVYIYTYMVNKNMVFKYLAYLSSNFLIVTICQSFAVNNEVYLYIPLITTLIVMIIEIIFKKCSDTLSDLYLAVSEIVAFGFIYWAAYYEGSLIAIVLALIFALIIVVDNIIFRNKWWNILPLMCAMPVIFINDFGKEVGIAVMLSAIIATSVISLIVRKISIFTVFSGIYVMFTALNVDNTYFNIVIFICWSVIHYLMIRDNKEKDIFKFLSYLSVLFLYNTVIGDLGLEIYTVCLMAGYVLLAMLTLRTIIIKYVDDIDIYEYVSFGLIYLIAFFQYGSEQDGMLFGVLLIAMVIISYIKKYGALFMTSIFTIIINIIMLTREFWFSVPWWGYLLTVGVILIGFAIRNEVSDKNSKKNAIDMLKNIKDKVEK